jgi:hypothetical protein
VNVHDVLGDRSVSSLVVLILEQPDQVETRQDGSLPRSVSFNIRSSCSPGNQCSLLATSCRHIDRRRDWQQPGHSSSNSAWL